MEQMLRLAHEDTRQDFMKQSRLIDILEFYHGAGLTINEMVEDVWNAFRSGEIDLYAFSLGRGKTKGSMTKKELDIVDRLHERAREIQPRGILPTWRYVRLR